MPPPSRQEKKGKAFGFGTVRGRGRGLHMLPTTPGPAGASGYTPRWDPIGPGSSRSGRDQEEDMDVEQVAENVLPNPPQADSSSEEEAIDVDTPPRPQQTSRGAQPRRFTHDTVVPSLSEHYVIPEPDFGNSASGLYFY